MLRYCFSQCFFLRTLRGILFLVASDEWLSSFGGLLLQAMRGRDLRRNLHRAQPNLMMLDHSFQERPYDFNLLLNKQD